MTCSIVKRQVREINRRIFANDMFYVDNENNDAFTSILSNIIQTFSPEDAISNLPTIFEVKESNINDTTLDKLKLLSKQSVYLQFNNRALADVKKLNIIRTLKDSGYKIIIEVNKDDTMFKLAKLIANIIKLDIKNIPQSFSYNADLLQCRVMAYNINTPEDYVLAESIGISLYEGEYLGEATHTIVPEVKHSNVGFIELLCMINTKTVNIQEVIKLISQDSLLASQVIRLANSRYFRSSSGGTTSISNAVVQIGLQNLKRWILLLEFGRNDNPREDILQSSYYRAILCERISKEKNGVFIKPNEAYLVGLLSQLDILTGNPMAMEINNLKLASTIEDSLIYRDNSGGAILNLIIAFEESNDIRIQKYCKALGIKKERMNTLYCKAIIDARNVWKSITEFGGIYL